MGAEATNISVHQLDEEIIGGIKAATLVANQTRCRSQRKLYTLLIIWCQCPAQGMVNAQHYKSRNSEGINDAIGCPRGGTITSLVSFPFSASMPMCDLYLFEFLSIYSAPSLWRKVTGGTLSDITTKKGKGTTFYS